MKKLHSHKNPILLGGGILITISIFLLFTTCDIGLGQIVNTEKPVISNGDDGNGPGSFLQGGSNKIELEVENKLGFKIEEVFMEVEYVDVNTNETVTKKVPAVQNPETGKWEFDLDVSDMADGQIKAWVTAIDESGNETRSTEITYFVKNKLPQVKMTLPGISDEDFDDPAFLNGLVKTDEIYMGLELMGLATDDYGIMPGWPKIKFWAEEYKDTLDSDDIPVDDNKFGQWRTAELPMNYKPGSTVAKFTYPFARLIEDETKPGDSEERWRLPKRKENGKYDENEFISLDGNKKYRFQVWVRDLFGNDNYYPNRTDNKRGPNGTAADPATAENKYIQVNYKALGEKPIVQIPDMPHYYNKVGNFEVHISVLSSDPNFKTAIGSKPVKVWINDYSDFDKDTNIMGPFYPTTVSAQTPYDYVLSVPSDYPGWGPEGTRFIKVTAEDNFDQSGSTAGLYFILDYKPPTVDFEQPSVLTNIHAQGDLDSGKFIILYPPQNSKPKWVTGEITAGGKSTDTNGISEIWFHVGKLGDDNVPDGTRKGIYQNDTNWTKTGLGSMTPHSNWSGSLYAWSFKYTYPIGYKAGSGSLVQEFDEIKNSISFNPDVSQSSNAYQTSGTEHNKERFYLPLYLKVIDVAGNIQVVHYKLSIDPLLDEPSIDFTYPKDGNTVGGTVRLSGIATDNIWMNTVLMRIHKDGVPGSPTSNDYYYKPPSEAWFFENNPGFLPAPTNKAGWFKTTLYGEGAVVNWTAQVNGDGGLNPTSAETVNVDIEVFGIDSDIPNGNPHIIGPIEKQTVKFSSKVPTITDVKITKGSIVRDYNEGISTSGKFDISMKISALKNESNVAINNVFVKVNSDPQVTVMNNDTANTTIPNYNTVWKITNPIPDPSNPSERKSATLTITVDSTIDGIIKGLGYGKTGVMELEITVEDATATNFRSTYNYRIGIDNFFPKGTIATAVMAYDDPANSKYFLVEGTASDSPTGGGSVSIQGIERVLVYFEKATINYNGNTRTVSGNGTWLDPKNGSQIGGGAANFQSWIVMNTARTGWTEQTTVPNETNFQIPVFSYDNTKKCYTSPSAMVIDYAEGDRTQDYDGDGTYGESWMGLTDKTWQARMLISNVAGTAQQFADGPYMVHYIIMDTAGNATHYQKDIYVENNKPFINSINIGTDIDFNNSIDQWTNENNPGEYRNNAVGLTSDSELLNRITTGNELFRIRNGRFGLRLEISKGNNQKQVTVAYVTRAATAIPVANMERGNVYQIASTAVSTDFTKSGSPNNYTNTVFVAAGKGEGSATVYPFTTVASQGPTNVTNGVNYFTFTNFGSVPDTTAGLFIIKVYDTTISGGREADQLAHAVLYTVAVSNSDTVNPKIEVADFGQKYTTKNATENPQDYDKDILTELGDAVYSDYVITSAGVKQGYVQYQSDSGGAKAYISGKVTFHGKVNDNHRIDRITVQIRNAANSSNYENGSEFTIAQRNTSTGYLDKVAANVIGQRDFEVVSTVPQFSLAYGHTLTWKFTWDSSLISTRAASDVSITFKVYDMATPTVRSTSIIKTVDIVPYISEVRTSLSEIQSPGSVFNRSALGGYPVRDNETITINGFNLGTFTTNNANNYARIGTDNITITSNNGTVMVANVNGRSSGPLNIAVNSIESFNNRGEKAKSASYNQEKNGINNDILDNSRYMYVWQAGYLISSKNYMSNPFMRVASNGTRLISYGYYNGTETGRLRVNRNNTDLTVGASRTNRMINTTVAVGGTNTFYAMGSDLSSNTNQGFQFARSTATSGAYSLSTTANQQYLTANYRGVKLIDMATAGPDRFKIPRIVAQATDATTRAEGKADRILIGFYDDSKNEVRIIYSNIGETTVGNMTAGTADANGSNAVDTTSSELVANNAGTFRGGMYTAVGLLSNGLPVIAWYDATNQNLVFSYGTPLTANLATDTSPNARVTTGNNIWQTNAVIIDRGKGTHVDMAIDAEDNIHLAYYSNSGGLYYALITPTGNGYSTKPDIVKSGDSASNITPVKVDTYLSAGTKIMINVRSDGTRPVPYITYAHASFPGTKNSVRVAWRVNFSSSVVPNGTDANDRFLGNWEVMTVPVNNIPNTDDFVCNGVPTVTSWTVPTAGTGSLAYNSNLNQTIIVGYLTDQNYEGSILKGTILTVPSILQKP
jgi:large repetitive protein